MSARIKICGITRLQDARSAAAFGADYLGFIQHEESPRYVTPAAASEMISWVAGPQPVGVFVNDDAETVIARCEEASFSHAQLHGHESVETCETVQAAGLTVIKTFQVVSDASAEQLRAFIEPYTDAIDYVLLDTHHTSLWGGTGESFNWRLAREVARAYPTFLAGGLSPGNVAEAIATMRPFAVDVSSSIEEAPGRKDPQLLAGFFDAYHAALDKA